MVLIEGIWPAELQLGEGPIWHVGSGRFFFVDIHGRSVHAWCPETRVSQSWRMPERIGWLIPSVDGDGFVAGFQSGFVRLWLEPMVRIEAIGCPHAGMLSVRLNDAKADRYGRIWAGSMNNDNQSLPDGCLTRLDLDGSFEVVERGIHIANGPAISNDGHWMLHTDSYQSTIYLYRMNAMGVLQDKAVWKKFAADEGVPDGMTFDAEGHVWIAFWGGSCIRCYSLEGELLRQIDLPASQITSMAFGGTNLDVMLVTSARAGLSAAQLKNEPQAGAVFLVHPGVRGVLPNCWGRFGFNAAQA